MMHKTCSINYGHLADLQKTLPTTDLNKKKTFHLIKYLLATFFFPFFSICTCISFALATFSVKQTLWAAPLDWKWPSLTCTALAQCSGQVWNFALVNKCHPTHWKCYLPVVNLFKPQYVVNWNRWSPLVGAKPLCEPMPVCGQLDPKEQNAMKY